MEYKVVEFELGKKVSEDCLVLCRLNAVYMASEKAHDEFVSGFETATQALVDDYQCDAPWGCPWTYESEIKVPFRRDSVMNFRNLGYNYGIAVLPDILKATDPETEPEKYTAMLKEYGDILEARVGDTPAFSTLADFK
ncbi:MAG TPA: hypothetical protein DCR21_07795 [Succinivibrionaceae bacterium]|nr:hypothetical protein [Succinivibrionaceae bacterium]